jgi:hypothetical protein
MKVTTNYFAIMRAGQFQGVHVFFDDTEELATKRAHSEALRIVDQLTEVNPNTREKIAPRVAVYRKPIFNELVPGIPAIVEPIGPRFRPRDTAEAA